MLSDKEINKVVDDVFAKYDTNHNGFLEIDEIFKLL